MSSSSAEDWKALFSDWPACLPRKGALSNSLNDQTPFVGFMVKGDMLLLERTLPDATGARFVLMSFGGINSVKFIDPLREADFFEAGFTGKFSK